MSLEPEKKNNFSNFPCMSRNPPKKIPTVILIVLIFSGQRNRVIDMNFLQGLYNYDMKEFGIFQLLENFKKNVLMHRPVTKDCPWLDPPLS